MRDEGHWCRGMSKVKQSREPVVVMVGVSRNEGCGRCFEVLGVSYDSLRSACCCAPALPCDDCSAFGR